MGSSGNVPVSSTQQVGNADAGLAGAQAVTAVGGFIAAGNSAEAQRRFAQSQAKQMQFEAKLTRDKAKEVKKIGRDVSAKHGKKVAQEVSSQRASLAAQGIAVNIDDAQTIQNETRDIGADEQATIINNANREALGLEVQATGIETSARLVELGGQAEAKATVAAGGLRAAKGIAEAGVTLQRGLKARKPRKLSNAQIEGRAAEAQYNAESNMALAEKAEVSQGSLKRLGKLMDPDFGSAPDLDGQVFKDLKSDLTPEDYARYLELEEDLTIKRGLRGRAF